MARRGSPCFNGGRPATLYPVQIDHGAAEFPYQQHAAYFRERNRSGADAPGSRLPSISFLVTETGLSPKTIRHAMKQLEDEGLVRIVPSRGVFVRGHG